MKFLVVFAAFVAVALSAPAQQVWTLQELSAALQNPSTDPAVLPHLEQALDQLMENLYSGIQQTSIAIPALEVSSWTLAELSEALQSPATSPALIPYLEHALNEYMDALFAGQQLESISVVYPADLGPIVEPSPVIVAPGLPVSPSPVVVPEAVAAPEAAAPSATSPLVQIIVNVNQAGQAVASPSPVVTPEIVQDTPVVDDFHVEIPRPTPVSAVSVVDVAPEPVAVVEAAPEPVQVVEPSIPVNPIDVIAITAPEVNPVDIINPIGVPPVAAGGDIVGPIV